jgi:hypothetical protein
MSTQTLSAIAIGISTQTLPTTSTQTLPTTTDVARDCPSTCIFPFNSWWLTGEVVDVTAPGCWQCKELAEAVKRGEVPSLKKAQEKVQKLLDKVRKELGGLVPGMYAPDVEFVQVGPNKFEVKINGIKVLTPAGEIRYIKADD